MSGEVQELPAGLDASALRVAVARATFNAQVTDGLLAGALELCERAGATDVAVVDVPGAFELPLFAQRLAAAGYDAIIALGAVIEGETDHDHLACAPAHGEP